MLPANYPIITIGELRRELGIYDDHYTLDFSGLTFSRLKQRGETHVQLEFSEAVSRTPDNRVVVAVLD